ncbi:hypothetical protein K466DRAFT_305127 [Polyporus arcularius HHB13444]|uniref:Uncharacterized protein n=1 Tax=Polyporus arcularius HHB13444 TaxID=1314778 RepID=A0A5C3NZX4_9APHY|nr:hypothetical protein K466DRAFT_305127 [Polyporus arcularius HHB13444]
MPTSKRTVTSLRLPQASRLGRRTSGCARGPLCRSQDKVHSHPFHGSPETDSLHRSVMRVASRRRGGSLRLRLRLRLRQLCLLRRLMVLGCSGTSVNPSIYGTTKRRDVRAPARSKDVSRRPSWRRTAQRDLSCV